MTLIKSISGIRGTIGGYPGEGLNPIDIIKFTTAFVTLRRQKCGNKPLKIVVGRDGRISGASVSKIVCGTLQMCGVNVIDVKLSTTPTVELAVTYHNADGGIILTASHNPAEWNALKLLNEKGEFISAEEGESLLKISDTEVFAFSPIDQLGSYQCDHQAIERHVGAILELPYVNKDAIEEKEFTVVFDSINSTGGMAIPVLLKELGVENFFGINEEPDGQFAHNPEPLPEHLSAIKEAVVKHRADVGFVVDPDVDRLAIVCEDGSLFGEEYTIVSIADYILSQKQGNTVSNLSSSMALKEVTEKHGGIYAASAVGEVNVVELMKKTNAVIGGEGNGGVILPELHYGRDALLGIALFLSQLAEEEVSVSGLRKRYPKYVISKNRITLDKNTDIDTLLKHVISSFDPGDIDTTDGVKIIFDEGWVHLRKSNTEPIIRVYAEAEDKEVADRLANQILSLIKKE